MRETIINYLRSIEKEFNVKVLFAVESGSRAWGFASADSDYDARFIYYSRLEAYLGINPVNEVIEKMIKDKEPLIDIVGWDLRKFATLFLKSNPTVSEWLTSDIIYINSPYMKKFNNLFRQGFSKNALINHYTKLARTNYEKYIRKEEQEVNLKKYVYVLRALACVEYINKHNDLPNLNYKKVIDNLPVYVSDFMNKIIDLKMKSESMRGSKNEKINSYIESYFTREIIKDTNKFDKEELNKTIIDIIKSFT